MIPKFSVGEIVVADFKNYPQNNGEYTVLEVMSPEQVKIEFKDFKIYQTIYYRLGGLEIIGPIRGSIYNAAAEKALRKKQEPSGFSFDELMDNLNTKIQESC